MNKKYFLLPLIFLVGCSNTTILNEKVENKKSGYSSTVVSDNIIEVFYSSKRNQSLEKTKDLLLLSSAKLAIEKDYKFFKIVKEDIKKIEKEYKRPVDIHYDYYRHQLWLHDIEIVEIDKYHVYEGNQKVILSNKQEEDYLDAEKVKYNILSKYNGKLVIE